jgi:surfactin synthase thioesterase subunit
MSIAADSQLALFCFPYAGGQGSVFEAWDSAATTGIEVIDIGRVESQTAEQLSEHARRLVDGNRERWEGRRFAFYGHSLGALLAFEAIRHLCRRRERLPEKLVVSACLPPREVGVGLSGLLAKNDMRQFLSRSGAVPQEILDDVADEFLAEIFQDARRDLDLMLSYRFVEDGPLPVETIAIGGSDDQLIEPGLIAGWRRYCDASFATRLFPGGHMFIESSREEFLEYLTDKLVGPQGRCKFETEGSLGGLKPSRPCAGVNRPRCG